MGNPLTRAESSNFKGFQNAGRCKMIKNNIGTACYWTGTTKTDLMDNLNSNAMSIFIK